MSDYRKIIEILLEASESIDVPDESMIKKGFVIKNKEGFEYTVEKVFRNKKNNKRKFLITSDGYEKLVNYKELKKFKRS